MRTLYPSNAGQRHDQDLRVQARARAVAAVQHRLCTSSQWRQAGNRHELSLIRWGLVPFWCDDPKSGRNSLTPGAKRFVRSTIGSTAPVKRWAEPLPTFLASGRPFVQTRLLGQSPMRARVLSTSGGKVQPCPVFPTPFRLRADIETSEFQNSGGRFSETQSFLGIPKNHR
jgi:hypothetical protein